MADIIRIKRNTATGVVPTTASGVVGELFGNTFDGRLWLRCNNGTDFVKEIGAGSTSTVAQRGMDWNEVSGVAPITSYEFDALVYKFSQGQVQAIVAFLHVPSSFSTGTQIKLRLGHYTSDVANNFKFQTLTTLIRKGVDAVSSTVNQYTSTNVDQAISATSNQYLEVVYDLTTAAGVINSIQVNPNDLIKIVLTRVATTGTDSTSDVTTIPQTAEVLFS